MTPTVEQLAHVAALLAPRAESIGEAVQAALRIFDTAELVLAVRGSAERATDSRVTGMLDAVQACAEELRRDYGAQLSDTPWTDRIPYSLCRRFAARQQRLDRAEQTFLAMGEPMESTAEYTLEQALELRARVDEFTARRASEKGRANALKKNAKKSLDTVRHAKTGKFRKDARSVRRAAIDDPTRGRQKKAKRVT